MYNYLKKNINKNLLSCAVLGCVFVSLAGQRVSAQQSVRIEIENLGGSTDFFLAPLWVGLHNGSFDLFSVGEAASPGLEELAEEGGAGILMTEAERRYRSGRLWFDGWSTASDRSGQYCRDRNHDR